MCVCLCLWVCVCCEERRCGVVTLKSPKKNTYLSVLISFSLSSTNYYISIYHTTNWHWGILVLEPCSKNTTFLTNISAFNQKIISCFIPLKELRLRYLPAHSFKSLVTWQSLCTPLSLPCRQCLPNQLPLMESDLLRQLENSRNLLLQQIPIINKNVYSTPLHHF